VIPKLHWLLRKMFEALEATKNSDHNYATTSAASKKKKSGKTSSETVVLENEDDDLRLKRKAYDEGNAY